MSACTAQHLEEIPRYESHSCPLYRVRDNSQFTHTREIAEQFYLHPYFEVPESERPELKAALVRVVLGI